MINVMAQSCHGLIKPVLHATGVTTTPAARSRRVSNNSKQNASAQSSAAVAGATTSVRRSQRQSQQRQFREKQEQDKIEHNVNVNARVSDTITLLASPAAPAECRKRESGVSETVDHAGLATDPNDGNEGSQCKGRACEQLPQQQRRQQQQQRRNGKASRHVHGTSSGANKGLVHSPKGVMKQSSPVGKGLPKGSSLGARFPLRVRKNLEQSQGKQYLQDTQGHQLQNRGLADTVRPIVS